MTRSEHTTARASTAVVNMVCFVIMIAANCLSIFLPLNNRTQMQLSAQYPNLFTPAGFTFSIWSVIYTLLLGFVVYQAYVLLKKQHPVQESIFVISPLFAGVCLCNASWLFAWHYEMVTLSVVIMLVHLWLLILIHDRLSFAISWKPFAPKLWLDITFSIYLGWICVATIANITAWFISLHMTLPFLPRQTWTVIMLVAATLIGIYYVFTRNNKFVALAIAWAFYGIIVKRSEMDNQASRNITLAAGLGIAFLLLIILLNAFRRRQPEYKPNMSA